eukprot:scaffold18962_cov140-Skeletonema_marinoi.AAC.8
MSKESFSTFIQGQGIRFISTSTQSFKTATCVCRAYSEGKESNWIPYSECTGICLTSWPGMWTTLNIVLLLQQCAQPCRRSLCKSYSALLARRV